MQIAELILIAVGLSMDAFAVSITKGLEMQRVRTRYAVLTGAWFGFFQALMPVIGYFLGSRFREQIEAVDHWVAFVILALIGANMIREAVREAAEDPETAGKGAEDGKNGEKHSADLRIRTMFLLAVATSIDALAVGITFALLQVNILSAALFIGCITFLISFGGVYIGHAFGSRYKKSAALLGGAILICIGLKILLEHMGVIG